MSYAIPVDVEMQTIVQTAAEPVRAGETIGAQISRAARVLGISPGRCKRFWYREVKAILAEDADTLRNWHRGWQLRQIATLDQKLLNLKAELGKCSHA
ncbi:hypothetical protein J2D73_19095 [Acetobacter sacchari]|uniref:MerR family transcriptional regulator n=1 Tax=Acetobacter sacchari TaxID=2661687 RepID=A0ABS3M128_9PROT|nr:hypothetical protein [Acetobacter sacchari]MBO1361892.1 hypothetical protein [Acetobacter sacchari]